MRHRGKTDGLKIRRNVLFGILYGAYSAMVPRPMLNAADASTTEGVSKQSPRFHFKGNAWLDFEMPDFRRIALAGKINDSPVRILLDSGVGASF